MINLTFRARQHDSREAVPGVCRGPHTFLWQYLVVFPIWKRELDKFTK
jgi:hypothetical protein